LPRIDVIFPSFIVTDNNRAYSIFNTIINNKSGGFMNVIVYFLITFICNLAFLLLNHALIDLSGLPFTMKGANPTLLKDVARLFKPRSMETKLIHNFHNKTGSLRCYSYLRLETDVLMGGILTEPSLI
jgi:hypothetical protein